MIFQTLDDKSECVGIYADGRLHFDDVPAGLTKTWKYSGSITAPNVEYASLLCSGLSLEEACPPEFLESFKRLQRQFAAYLQSFRIGKIDLREHCFFDLVPPGFLLEFCDARNQITKHVFDNFQKPANYDHLDKLAKLLHKIKYQDLNINNSNCKSLFYSSFARAKVKDLLNGNHYIDYNIFGTVTGRLTTQPSSFPVLTMMKEMRSIVKPRNDLFVSLDYNGAEVRTFLALCGQSQPQEDIHDWNRKTIFRNRTMNRSEAKTTFFAWLYNPASNELQSPEYDRDNALQKYYENGVITTPYGRQMIVEDKKALNYLIQSTTADLVLEKAVQIDELLTNKKSFISHIVHDEVVLDISHDERDLISEIKEVFSNNQLGSYLVNLKVGKNYLDLEDFKV